MRHIEFLRDFPNMELRPFYIFVGQETLPLDRFLEMLAERTGAQGIKRFYGDEQGPGDVMRGSFTGLFGESFVAFVRSAEKMKGWEMLLSAGFTPRRPLALLFEKEIKKKEDPFKFLSRNARLWGTLNQKAYLVELPPLDEPTFTAWVGRQLKSLGVRISSGAFKELLDALPRDLRRARAEIVKLATYLNKDELHSLNEIRNLLCEEPETAEYRITDNALAGRASEAMEEVDKWQAVGMKPEDLLPALGRALSAMAWAKLGQKNMVRLSWKVKKYEDMARGLTERDVFVLLDKELYMEMGPRRRLDPRLCLLSLLLELRK
ncbi:MAG: hypothetical protein ABIM59_08320 [candidate division WOR-3 bacterium]